MSHEGVWKEATTFRLLRIGSRLGMLVVRV